MPQSKRLLTLVGLIALATTPLFAQDKDKEKDKAAAPTTATQGATPEVGQVTLDYTYKNFISGDGRSSMMDFRGSVVLVDWWGIH